MIAVVLVVAAFWGGLYRGIEEGEINTKYQVVREKKVCIVNSIDGREIDKCFEVESK